MKSNQYLLDLFCFASWIRMHAFKSMDGRHVARSYFSLTILVSSENLQRVFKITADHWRWISDTITTSLLWTASMGAVCQLRRAHWLWMFNKGKSTLKSPQSTATKPERTRWSDSSSELSLYQPKENSSHWIKNKHPLCSSPCVSGRHFLQNSPPFSKHNLPRRVLRKYQNLEGARE